MGVIDASSADSRVQKSAQVVLVLGAIAAILALLYAIWHRRSALTDPAGLHDALVYYALPLSILAVVLLLMAFWPRLDRLLMLLMVGAAFLPSSWAKSTSGTS